MYKVLTDTSFEVYLLGKAKIIVAAKLLSRHNVLSSGRRIHSWGNGLQQPRECAQESPRGRGTLISASSSSEEAYWSQCHGAASFGANEKGVPHHTACSTMQERNFDCISHAAGLFYSLNGTEVAAILTIGVTKLAKSSIASCRRGRIQYPDASSV